MHLYKVGEPYSPSRRSWPEGNDYNFRGGEHELRLFLARPSRHEIEAVQRGAAEFALFVEPPLVSLCYRFETRAGRGLPWSDANFSWHAMAAAVGPEELVLPIAWEEGSPETRALLQVVLVDASDGIIRAMRSLAFSPEFTRAIHRAIWEQAHAPWDRAAYTRAQSDLYRRYPTSEALVAACQHRTKGGV